jgi:nucleoside-diphosphate-sugar epimerase
MTVGSKNVVVTGAGGAVGSALVPKLLASGCSVTSMLRSSYSLAANSEKGIKLITADVRFPAQYLDHLRDIDTVVHLAARMGGTELDDFMEVNLFGTQQVAKSFFEQNPEGQFIYVSSISAMGQFDEDDSAFKLESDYSSNIDNYGLSKKNAENWLERYAEENKVEVLILRPGVIYGATMPCWLKDMAEDVRLRRLRILSEGAKAIPLTHIDNLNSFILSFIKEDKRFQFKKFICVDEDSPALNSIMSRMADIFGVSIGKRKWGPTEAKIRGFLGGVLAKRDGRSTVITKSRIKLISSSQRFDGSALRQEIPHVPLISWEEGIEELCRRIKV